MRPTSRSAPTREPDEVGEPDEVLLLGGCAGVGKSSVAAELHVRLARAGVRHAVIEGDVLDLAWPAPHERGLALAERNLATIWGNYRAAGYHRLVYVNTASVRGDVIDALLEAIGGTPTVHGVLLTAERSAVVHRLGARERGTGLEEHLERSERAAAQLQREAPPWVDSVDTTGRNIASVADEIITALRWTADAA